MARLVEWLIIAFRQFPDSHIFDCTEADMTDVQQVIGALNTLYNVNDRAAKSAASKWLDDFQQTVDAWGISNQLLQREDVGNEVKTFASQTLRRKVKYDLTELDAQSQIALRDSIISMLQRLGSGPMAVITQLCCCLAQLAIYMKGWDNPVEYVGRTLGTGATNASLEFLTVLPEELERTQPLLTKDEYAEEFTSLLEANGSILFSSLCTSLQDSNTPFNLQTKLFRCLESWISIHAVSLSTITASPIIVMAFDALQSEELFDSAIEIICSILDMSRDLIVKKSEESLGLLSVILPRVTICRQGLEAAAEDEDKARGYCRMFTEACETYLPIIVEQPQNFSTLLEGILVCTTFEDLDIIRMTFDFWFRLAELIMEPQLASQKMLFSPVFSSLADNLISHLRYPDDLSTWTAQDKDEFSDYRHEMGDVLKDCVRVLGAETVLAKPYNLLTSYAAKLTTDGEKSVAWQDIEAPLFSLRAMGSSINDDESVMLPQIMELIPKLPPHPKIRYAVTLVIGVYSKWTRKHPQFVTYQMDFISPGFGDSELAAAAAKSLKYLCQDCGELLLGYIEQLLPFYTNAMSTLHPDDVMDITEGIAHIIAKSDLGNMLPLLQSFALPIIQRLNEVSQISPQSMTPRIEKETKLYLNRLSVFMKVVRPEVSLATPHPVVTIVESFWPVLKALLQHFSTVDAITEGVAKVFRQLIETCSFHFLPHLSELIQVLVSQYDSTHLSCYLWVAFHIVGTFSKTPNGFTMVEQLNHAMSLMVNQLSESTFAFFEKSGFSSKNADVLEEYFHFIRIYSTSFPDQFHSWAHLPILLSFCTTTFTEVYHPDALSSLIQFINSYMSTLSDSSSDSSKTPSLQLVHNNAQTLISVIIQARLEERIPTDSLNEVVEILRTLGSLYGKENEVWIAAVVGAISDEIVGAQDKQKFLTNYIGGLSHKSGSSTRDAINKLAIIYRRKTSRSRKR